MITGIIVNVIITVLFISFYTGLAHSLKLFQSEYRKQVIILVAVVDLSIIAISTYLTIRLIG